MTSQADAIRATTSEYNVAIRSTSVNIGESCSFREIVKNIKTTDDRKAVEVLNEEDSSVDTKQLKLDFGGEGINILDNSAARHKLSIRPKKKHGDPRQGTIFSVSETNRCPPAEDVPSEGQPSDSHNLSNSDRESRLSDVRCRREAVVKELLETEEEFGRDLMYVVNNYLKPSILDGSSVPRAVRDNTDIIFSNFQQISDFHNTTLLEGIKYYSDEPRLLGKTFLRLERDFDKHITYCRDEPLAQEFLAETPQVTEFFEELSQKLGDGKNISEYLKLPVQRINDYQVLLKDLVKYSDKLGESIYDLERALELMLAIPQRANDNKFLSNIEGFHGNIHKLGRLLKHDWFSVVFEDEASKERYLFLFKGHIIVCKVKKISEDRSVFILKNLISLSDIKIKNYPDEKTFEILGKYPEAEDACLKIIARKDNSKSSWLSEIKKHAPEVFHIEEKVTKDANSRTTAQVEAEQKQIGNTDTITSVPAEDSNQTPAEKPQANNILLQENSQEEAMSRRSTTRKSYKAYEESYSMSSQREVYSHSSATASSRFSSTSAYETTKYESSIASTRASARAIAGRAGSLTGSTKLSITSADKPAFTRTITGLNLEPGDTAVFECHLESEAQLTWLKDNKPLNDKLADRVVCSSSDDGIHRLELQHVTELDSGTYTAIAQNDNGYATCTAQLLIHQISDEEKKRRMEANAPIFTVRLKDTELLINTNFRFMVKVKGNPNPDVKFYKGGVPIVRYDDHVKVIDDMADIGFYELVISDVQSDHAGLYSCKASNEYGEAHCEGTVTVTDHKMVFKGLENEMLLTPGEKPSFTWVKDGKPFDPDERFKVLLGNEDDSLALIFQHVRPEDAGLYTCVASTTTGRISCSAELSVQGSVMPLSREPEKPKVVNEQRACEATIGSSAMLEAKIVGFPKPEVKWYHEGEEIQASGRFKFLYEDQETMTLVIKNVNPRDGGCYKIIAKNELGEDCTELSLTVKGAPKITKKMEDIHVKEGEVITLKVGVEGSPTPDVKWYKSEQQLTETERIKLVKNAEQYSLVIEGATAADAGSYSVVASNEINQCMDFCHVKVHSAPQIIKKMEKNVEVTEEEDITFEIKIGSESDAKVKWLKDGVEIQSDEKKTKIIAEGDVHTLKILNSDAKDSAEYSVEITNEYGVSTDKGKATVRTKTYAPTFKKALKDAIAKEGDTNVEFSVEISAYPKPKIRWYLGDTEISEKRTEYTKIEKDDSYKLILKKVTTELKGNYTCKVENDYGSAETTAKLTVHSKPIFVKQLQPKITAEEGAELTIQIECFGCPEPEVTWYKDGQEVQTDAHIKITKDLHRSESYSMTLTLIQTSDSGEYEARASNCMGSATTKTYVQVFSKVSETTQEEIVKGVKQEPVESQQAIVTEEKGTEDKPTILEPRKTKISFSETEWGFKVEELDNSYAEEKPDGQFLSQGIVEEVLDSENVNEHCYHRLIINRGVSIVSLSDDDRTLSRNNSGLDLENYDKNDFEDEETSKSTGKRTICAKDELHRGMAAAEQSDLWASPAATTDFWASLENQNKPQESAPEAFKSEESDFRTSPKTENQIKTRDVEEIPPESAGQTSFKDDDFWSFLENTPKGVREISGRRPDTAISDQKESLEASLSEVEESHTEKTLNSTEGAVPSDGRKPVEGDLRTSPINSNKHENDFWTSASNDGKGVQENPSTTGHRKAAESDYRASPAAKPSQPEEGDFWATLTCEGKQDLAVETLPNVVGGDGLETLPKGAAEAATESDHRTLPEAPEEAANNESDSSSEKAVDERKVEMFEAPPHKPVVRKLEKHDQMVTAKENGDIRISEGPEKVPKSSEYTEHESDGEDDPAVKALLSRIKKQRSVLEEILTKEAESRKEDTEFKQKPTFRTPLQNQECSKEDTATFKCVVAAAPEPEVIWLHDGEEIKVDGVKMNSETVSQQLENATTEYTYTLRIRKPEVADAGLYMIKAKNKYGFDESSATLTIKVEEEAKPEIRNLKDVTVNLEENAIFEAEVIGTASLVVTWLDKNGDKLKSGDRIVITEDKVNGLYKLTIKKSRIEDVGEYILVASNSCGETTKAVKLSLQEPSMQQKPVFKVPLKDQKCSENDIATFKCVVVANPEPEITWLLNGQQKIDGGKVKTEISTKEVEGSATEYTYILKINEVGSADAGVCKAKVKNKYGFDESSANLTIQIKEDTRLEIKNLKDVTVIPDEDATFEAEVMSNLSVTVKWLDKNGEKIESDDHFIVSEDKVKGIYQLIIKNAKAENAGEYTLVATNDSGERSHRAKLFVSGERPTIVKPIEDTRVKDGADVDFMVRCNGIPKPDVEWFKDGKKLFSDERMSIKTQAEGQVSSSLSIEKFGATDEGQYKVVAKNAVGSAENSFALKLFHLPPVMEKGLPRSEEVDENEVLELKCKLSGSPVPQVAWLKDGVPLVPSDRVKVIEQPDGLVKLCIEDMKLSDSGTYTLKAENPNGDITANCAVAVTRKNCKPKIIDGMKDAKAEVGQPLKLQAQVMSFPSPEVKWFKDGKPLRPSQTAAQNFNEDDGTIELVIKSIKPEDAGLYSLKVCNKLGEATQEAKVDVIKPLEKPSFEANLMPVSVVEGFPVRLDVKATGNPKPIIKWIHNGKEIVPDGVHIIVKEEPNGVVSLLIDKATPENAGEYVAKAINDQGEAISRADLDVLGKKTGKEEMEPSFLRPLNNVAVQEEDGLTLSAPIAGNPIPEVTWEKDGKPLLSDDRVLLTCDGKKVNLEIKSCKPSDTGVYSCHLRNSLGADKSKANVTVKKVFTEPIFVEKFKDTDQVENADTKFVARITGNRKPEAEWFFNGQPIVEGDKYQIKCDGDRYSLLVKNCKPSDSGLYRCSAFNKAGRADCVAQLNVVQKVEAKQRAEPPSFLKKISDCDIYKGMTAKFTACCTGFPEPEFEWFCNGRKLETGNRVKIEAQENGLIRLTITAVGDDDVGNYRLRLFNPHGEAECSARLSCDILEPRPKKAAAADKEEFKDKHTSGIPLPLSDKPIISRMTDRHLTLSWKPYIPQGPGTPVTYIVEMCKHPDGDWFTVRKGIRSCACDVRNLQPFQDYKFRVRVENKYGISDPSPFAMTYREKIIPDPPKFVPYLSPGIDFRPETSPYFPKDFDLERPPHDRYEQAPKFLRQEQEVQYGIKNQNSNLFWFVYGYPKPTITYYFNDEPVEMGGRYECSYTRNGQATLFINSMLDRDVGIYEAVAKNEHGEARQRVRLEIAEHPVFIQRPEESYIMLRGSGELTARITGVPYPEIKWYKDWQALAPSSRIKMQQVAPDTVTLTISDAIMKDEGLYSVSARNVAGSVSSSVMVHIEEQEEAYKYATYDGRLNIKPRSEPHSNYYDIGDELGRGTQGIIYHAVERQTGQNYAAKFLHGRSELKPFMMNELSVMNSLNHRKLIRLHDSFETKDLIVLVVELAGGGELLEWLTKQTYITEYEIADYIRQILWGLEHMHSNGYAHLSLTLNDLLMSRPDGDDIKICDFGLSRRITHGNLMALNYGMPEFVAPEVIKGEGVSYSADMWSLGIITYILLSGFSPFKGLNDRETLTRIKEGSWRFEDCFSNISSEAKDFISRLLAYKPEERMDVKTALRHPWLEKIGLSPPDQYRIKTDSLRSYYSSLQNWYKNANCRTWYRRQPLENAFTHPSKMVYPPAHDYTPEQEIIPVKSTRQLNGRPLADIAVPTREPLDYEVGNFKSESHYQYGPDTYLLQLRDVDLPCRLRHYMKVAANREQSYYSEPPEKHLDWRTPVIRERRKFTDVMDEEIDDERKARISQYGSDDIYSLRRLKHEISCRSDGHAEAEAMLEYKREGHIPFFREKPQSLAILQNQPAELSCMVVGDPDPVVQWFKNDLVLAESSRIKMKADQNKRYYLKFEPALQVDVGAYKVVARNKVGQTVARMRIVLATVPLSPDPPELVAASDTEVLLKWKQECDDVFTPVLCYSLQYKQTESIDWITLCKRIDQEFWLVKDLQPAQSYEFRLLSKNCAGWSAPGIPSAVIKTKESGASKISVSETQRMLQCQIEGRDECELPGEETKPRLDYSIEEAPLEWIADSNVEAKYNFTTEIFRGQFSMVVKGVEKSNNEQIVAKFCEVNASTEKLVGQEFEHFRSLRHERIVTLLSAMRPAPNIAIFVMEKLQGADILTYFASRQEYNEDMLVTVFTQVLDGLQYLHWRGYCHLDVQPDNIVLASVKSLHVKLVDFGSAQKVSKLGTVVSGPFSDYTAPEILNNEPAFPQTDIWSLGTLLYVLLSGVSPFKADTEDETKQNITFVRYRFEHLYKEITQESQRLLMQIFKRTPSKRPTVEECYEARWFLSSEFMIKKRLKSTFPGSRLKEYSDAYHSAKSGKGLALSELAKAFGEKVLRRSNSIQEELNTF